jgi:hypothetical protein
VVAGTRGAGDRWRTAGAGSDRIERRRGTEAGTDFPLVYTGIDIFRIEDGKLAELWQNTDDAGLEQQFAAAAEAGSPEAGTPTT